MNKEEMLKEFWRIYFENITRKGEALPLFEWFWKHLEQREKLISDYEKDVGRLKVERASLYDLLEAAEEIIKQSPVGTTHRKEALESYTTLKQQMK